MPRVTYQLKTKGQVEGEEEPTAEPTRKQVLICNKTYAGHSFFFCRYNWTQATFIQGELRYLKEMSTRHGTCWESVEGLLFEVIAKLNVVFQVVTQSANVAKTQTANVVTQLALVATTAAPTFL